MVKIGFIGTGVMGTSMIRNLMQQDHELHIYTRTKSKAEALLRDGAIWHANPAELAEQVDLIITMVGYPSDVEALYLGDEGILAHLPAGSVAIDMTTSSPHLAARLAEEGHRYHIDVLDAPVSGGDIGAKQGTLSIMVGGDQAAFSRVEPVLSVLGKQIIWQGAAGAGQHTKMVNQIAIASNMIGVTEAIVYAEKAGLDPERVLESISGGAAGSWSLSNLIPRVLKNDFEPGFFIKHFIKDMRIALDEAQKMSLELPGLELAEKMYQILAQNGLSEKGTQALIRYYQ
ncbi:NAD(P)-dependent oxidoreductase [Listeria costaricensis]|uniref:NAD(P)-dependent oxidoreductase n=1 Tax=Listeria costaricensis TaxID=2026604 RepID=UPI000C089ADF|nr:NAD(P)-dependent oxidoreductase [Listeria costaricensis]